MQNRDAELRILIHLLNTGETAGQKVHPPPCFWQELSLLLGQSSFAKRYLMKAMFAKAWAMAVVMRG
jgi:hypothetical protein